MALSRREKSLVLVLPAVAVLGVYDYIFALPQYRKTEATQKSLQAIQAKTSATYSHAPLTQVMRELVKESADLALVKAKWERCIGTENAAISRPERIEKLNAMLQAAS